MMGLHIWMNDTYRTMTVTYLNNYISVRHTTQPLAHRLSRYPPQLIWLNLSEIQTQSYLQKLKILTDLVALIIMDGINLYLNEHKWKGNTLLAMARIMLWFEVN